MAHGSPNRFVRAIRSGEIDSIEELKTAFREQALATHPDLGGTSATADPGEAFIAVRAEYEAALSDFERHRFGSVAARRGDEGGQRSAHVGSEELWGCLSLLLKRGFPKEPRHEKEILRYEYARWRFRGALASLARERGSAEPVDHGPALDRFEGVLLGMKKRRSPALGIILSFLRELIDYASGSHPAMRVALVRDFEHLKNMPELGFNYGELLALLAGELGIGPTLPG